MAPKQESKYPPSFVLTLPVLYDSTETYHVGDEIRTEELTITRTLNNAMLYQRLSSYNVQLEKRAVREKLLDHLVLYAHDRSLWDKYVRDDRTLHFMLKMNSQFKPAGADGGTGKTRKLRDESLLNKVVEELFGKRVSSSDDTAFKSTSNTIIDRRRPTDIENMRHLARLCLDTRPMRVASVAESNNRKEVIRNQEQHDREEISQLRLAVGALTAQLQSLSVLTSNQPPDKSLQLRNGLPSTPLVSSTGCGSPGHIASVMAADSTPCFAPAPSRATGSLTPPTLPASVLANTTFLHALPYAHHAAQNDPPVASTAHSSAALPHVESQSPFRTPSPLPLRIIKLTLESGATIELNINDLQLPISYPSLSFASPDRYKCLFLQWDCSDIDIDLAFLVLPRREPGAQVIPVSVWDQLFQKKAKLAEERAWKDLKSSWHNWKYLVEEYRRLGSSYENFIAHYTVDNVLQSYTTILARLKAERDRQHTRDVQHAKTFFGGDLFCEKAGNTFKYKKSNAWHNLQDAGSIARAWRSLLAGNETVRREWESALTTVHGIGELP